MSEHSSPSGDLLEEVKGQLSDMSDLEQRNLELDDQQVSLIYIKSLCDSAIINRFIVSPFFAKQDMHLYEEYIVSFPGTVEVKEAEEAVAQMLLGNVGLRFHDGRIFLFEAARVEASPVAASETEVIVQGPSDSFTESIEVNINLIRRRYKSADLKSELKTIGAKSKTQMAILYDEKRVDHGVLQELAERLDQISVDLIQSAAELDKYLASNDLRIFPTTIVTERPDRAVFNLSEGKVIVLVDTAGYAVILPVIFSDFFTAMDDKLQVKPVGWFLKTIRYIGLMLTVMLPSIYVAFTSYNSEVWKIQIALLVAGSRATVPYPSYVEVLFMLFMMECLTEASLRLPKAIGSTATTVGGLILGTAATEAGLVSNIMIILVSVVAISNFVIPLNMMGFTVRILKYVLVFLAAIYGLLGVVGGLVGLIMFLSSLRSFGKPYFRIFALDSLFLPKASRGGKRNG
ncbi:spore germination protein [Paenibacillus sp. JX-17]|uniref:Spore germination protein n=1 Tax=Paenibacillus lacisoli TaxID=3064525 RepID=A0ABT9C9X8_9BACL|nr:spore germination protein [Paenibacillus sp. JX-17]MDO7906062.1 spore germination protein [Paenibacillus sp. JX-17]